MPSLGLRFRRRRSTGRPLAPRQGDAKFSNLDDDAFDADSEPDSDDEALPLITPRPADINLPGSSTFQSAPQLARPVVASALPAGTGIPGVSLAAADDGGLVSSSDSGDELGAESDSDLNGDSSDDEIEPVVPVVGATPSSGSAPSISSGSPVAAAPAISSVAAAPQAGDQGFPVDSVPTVPTPVAELASSGSPGALPTGTLLGVDGAAAAGIEAQPSSGAENRGAAVGIALGTTVAIALLIAAAFFVMRSRRRSSASDTSSNASSSPGLDFFALPRKVKDTFAARRAARASTTSTYHWKFWDGAESSRASMPQRFVPDEPVPPLPAMPKQTNSQMLDTLMRAAYDTEQGRNDMDRGVFGDEKDYYLDEKHEMQQQRQRQQQIALAEPPPTATTDKPISKWLQGVLTPRQSKMPSERGIQSMYSQSATTNDDSMSSSSSDFFDSRNGGRSWQQEQGFSIGVQQVRPPQDTYSAGRPNVL